MPYSPLPARVAYQASGPACPIRLRRSRRRIAAGSLPVLLRDADDPAAPPEPAAEGPPTTTPPPTPPPVPPGAKAGGWPAASLLAAWPWMLVMATLYFLHWARALLIPLTLGIVLAFALNPLVKRLQRWHLPRPAGATVAVVVLWGCGYLLIYGMQENLGTLVRQAPVAAERLATSIERMGLHRPAAVNSLKSIAEAVDKATAAAAGERQSARVLIESSPSRLRDFLWMGSTGLATLLSQLVLVSFLVYFLLASGDLLKRKFLRICGSTLSRRKISLRLLQRITLHIQYSLWVLMATNVAFGVGVAVSFAALGVENAVAWGLVSTIVHLVPYFGSTVIAVGAGLSSFIQFNDWVMPVAVFSVTLVIATLVGTLVTTWLQSRTSQMDPAFVFIGLLVWGWIWGIWGLLLGVPLLAIAKVICDQTPGLKPFAILLGRQVPPPRRAAPADN